MKKADEIFLLRPGELVFKLWQINNLIQTLRVFECSQCRHSGEISLEERGQKKYSKTELYLPITDGTKPNGEKYIKAPKEKIVAITGMTCPKCHKELNFLPLPLEEEKEWAVTEAFCQMQNLAREVYGPNTFLSFRDDSLIIVNPGGINQFVKCSSSPRKIHRFSELLYERVMAQRRRLKQRQLVLFK